MSQVILKGRCLCGTAKYEVAGEAKRFYHCHCSRCRKATGTGHASNLFLQPATLKWLSGEEHIRAFKVPEAKRFTNQFCGLCGRPPATPACGDRHRGSASRIIGRRSTDQAAGAHLHRFARELVLLRRRGADLPRVLTAVDVDPG